MMERRATIAYIGSGRRNISGHFRYDSPEARTGSARKRGPNGLHGMSGRNQSGIKGHTNTRRGPLRSFLGRSEVGFRQRCLLESGHFGRAAALAGCGCGCRSSGWLTSLWKQQREERKEEKRREERTLTQKRRTSPSRNKRENSPLFWFSLGFVDEDPAERSLWRGRGLAVGLCISRWKGQDEKGCCIIQREPSPPPPPPLWLSAESARPPHPAEGDGHGRPPPGPPSWSPSEAERERSVCAFFQKKARERL